MGKCYFAFLKGNIMRLISFTRLGDIGFGALVDGGVVDLTNQLD